MTDSIRRVAALAGHEYRAAVRSRTLGVLLAVLVAVTAVSVYIGAVGYRSQLADYEAYRAAAQAGGLTQIAPSPLAPLSLLRGSFEYLEIIGAVVAIVLGYLSVTRERSGRTLGLVRSRPVTAAELAAGTLLGALGVMATLVAVVAAVGVVSLGVIGNDWVNADQAFRLLLAYIAATIYLLAFYGLGAVAVMRSTVAANGLMVALGIWLVVVLVLPQIGDTLDADNQLPGGLFAALGLNHDGEVAVLTHFTGYERFRTWTEEASLAKHVERFTFAMTDVKERYRGQSLAFLFGQTRNDIVWLLGSLLALVAVVPHTVRRQRLT